MPLVLIYAAASVEGFPTIARSRRPAFWLAAGLCGMFLAAWIWNILGPDSSRFLNLIRGAT
jgi:hypothetical protein